MNRKIVIEIQDTATLVDIVSFMDSLSDKPFVKEAYLKYGSDKIQKAVGRMSSWEPPTGERVEDESLVKIK